MKLCQCASADDGGSNTWTRHHPSQRDCQRIEDALRQRIERDITSGFLQKATSADALAGMTMAVISGMSVLARDGAGRQKLLAIAEQTLRGWPY